MALEKVRHKTGMAGIGGGAQCVLGAACCLLGLLVMFWPSRTASVGYYLLYCLGALVLALGIWTGLRGLTTRRLVKRLDEMEKLFQNGARVPLETAASYLRCSLSELVGSVRAMQKRGFVTGIWADLLRRDLVSAPYGTGVDVSSDRPIDESVTLTEETRGPVTPLYALGLTWVVWALGLPLYRITHLVACGAASLGVYLVVRARAAEQLVIVEIRKAPPAPVRTGNQAVDEMLQSAQKPMESLRRLDREITSGRADQVVREILRTTEQIIDHVKEHPDSAGQIRQFLGYTLPTTVNLLQNYQELSRQRVQGENITQALEKIEGMMDTILAAFHRQLDALFRDKALNIEVELDVMKEMLSQQGGGNGFGSGGTN